MIKMQYEFEHRITDTYGQGKLHEVNIVVHDIMACQVERLKMVVDEVTNKCGECDTCELKAVME